MTVQNLYADLHSVMGARYFTIMVLDRAAGETWLVYSSNPGILPAPNRGPMLGTGWALQVMIEGEAFIANSSWEVADVVPDAAGMLALGCGAVMNLPVTDPEGEVLGCVTMWDVEDSFDEVRVFAVQSLLVTYQADLVQALQRELAAG